MTKTTKKDFDIFRNECEKWISFFGLTEWETLIQHKELTNGAWATCSSGYAEKQAELTLNTEWQDERPLNEEMLKTFAFHEVCHLLFSDLVSIGMARYVEESEFENKEHEVISRLTNSVFKKFKKIDKK